jgi:hypothetical protein
MRMDDNLRVGHQPERQIVGAARKGETIHAVRLDPPASDEDAARSGALLLLSGAGRRLRFAAPLVGSFLLYTHEFRGGESPRYGALCEIGGADLRDVPGLRDQRIRTCCEAVRLPTATMASVPRSAGPIWRVAPRRRGYTPCALFPPLALRLETWGADSHSSPYPPSSASASRRL